MQVLNACLEGKDFLVANRFTLADLNVASVVDILFALGEDLSPYPHVAHWFKKATDRPSYRKFQQICEQD